MNGGAGDRVASGRRFWAPAVGLDWRQLRAEVPIAGRWNAWRGCPLSELPDLSKASRRAAASCGLLPWW